VKSKTEKINKTNGGVKTPNNFKINIMKRTEKKLDAVYKYVNSSSNHQNKEILSILLATASQRQINIIVDVLNIKYS